MGCRQVQLLSTIGSPEGHEIFNASNYFTRQSPEWKMLMVFLPCHFSCFSQLTWYVAEPEVVGSANFFF